MKKLILSVSMVLMSLNGYPQTSGFNNSPGSFDSSNNPSGVGFGTLGGANTTTQGTTTTPGSTVTPTGAATGTSTVPSTTFPQERQEDLGNFAGGTMSGQTQDDRGNPSNSTVAPTRAPTSPSTPNNVPSATGFGSGAPTSY